MECALDWLTLSAPPVGSNFLLFMPACKNESPLQAVMSFYTSIVTVTAEGDSVVRDDRLNGLGRRVNFLIRSVFGSVLAITARGTPATGTRKPSPPSGLDNSPVDTVFPCEARPDRLPESSWPASSGGGGGAQWQRQRHGSASISTPSSLATPHDSASSLLLASCDVAASPQNTPNLCPAPLAFVSASTSSTTASLSSHLPVPASDLDPASQVESAVTTTVDEPQSATPPHSVVDPSHHHHHHHHHRSSVSDTTHSKGLTSFVPDPGYFLAGAAAGGVSRTATAPLDRLKVFLLVNTKSSSSAASTGSATTAAKQGRPAAVAMRRSMNPIVQAVHDIYGSGGLRSFFAGELG